MSPSSTRIRVALEALGRPEVDPRHVEAYVDSEALAGADEAVVHDSVRIALRCVDKVGTEEAEALARRAERGKA